MPGPGTALASRPLAPDWPASPDHPLRKRDVAWLYSALWSERTNVHNGLGMSLVDQPVHRTLSIAAARIATSKTSSLISTVRVAMFCFQEPELEPR
jgi:hypothetical protein